MTDEVDVALCAVSQFGHTALSWASIIGHTEVVKALLAAGAGTETKEGVGGDDEAWDGPLPLLG